MSSPDQSTPDQTSADQTRADQAVPGHAVPDLAGEDLQHGQPTHGTAAAAADDSIDSGVAPSDGERPAQAEHVPTHAAADLPDDIWRRPDATADQADAEPAHRPQHARSLGDDLLGGPAAATVSHRGVAPTASDEPEPEDLLVRARGLELAGRESMVFGPLDFDLFRGRTNLVVGQQGSGRSALLLTLSGRLQGVQGALSVCGTDAMAHPRQVRKATSVARITGLAELEENLTVGEQRDERAIADGLGQRKGRDRFRLLEEALGHNFQLDQWVGRMPAVERTLLTVVLGALVPSDLVVLDDVDDSLTGSQLSFIHDAMAELTRADHANFVVSAIDADGAPADATIVRLPAPPPRNAPDLLPLSTFRHTAREDA